MDKERTARELKEWEDRQARGEVTGPYPGRLMTTAEVPKHIRAEDVVFDRQARREAELATCVLPPTTRSRRGHRH